METPAYTFQLDHNGGVIRIVGNRSGLQALMQELASIMDLYKDGVSIPLMSAALCIYQGGTNTVEYVCDDSILDEKY